MAASSNHNGGNDRKNRIETCNKMPLDELDERINISIYNNHWTVEQGKPIHTTHTAAVAVAVVVCRDVGNLTITYR